MTPADSQEPASHIRCFLQRSIFLLTMCLWFLSAREQAWRLCGPSWKRACAVALLKVS